MPPRRVATFNSVLYFGPTPRSLVNWKCPDILRSLKFQKAVHVTAVSLWCGSFVCRVSYLVFRVAGGPSG